MPGLPLGVRPVRGTVGASGLALPQFLVVAEHLDGQQGDGFQPPKQILDPSGILADDMVDDGPCSGFRRRRDSRVKRFDEGQAGPFEAVEDRFMAACGRTQQLVDGQHEAAYAVHGVQPIPQGFGQRRFPGA